MKPVLTLCAQPLFESRGSPIRVKAFVRALGKHAIPNEVITLPIGPCIPLPATTVLRRIPNFLGVRSIAIGPSIPKLLFGFGIAAFGFVRALPRRFRIVHGIEEMGLPAWMIARVTGARFVYEKHSDPASYRTGSPFRRAVIGIYARLERFICRRADTIIATGPGTAGQARSYGVSEKVIQIDDVPSAEQEADPARVESWRERIGVRKGETVFAYIGSFATYQGVPLFLEAADLALKNRRDLRVALIGGKKNKIERLRKQAMKGGYNDRFFHCHRIDSSEVADFLTACDVLVSPRLSGNNTPLKMLDYLRSGRCVLATDTNANRLILDESTAHFTRPEREALAQAMSVLADSPEARSRLGAAGRRIFLERYGIDRFETANQEVFG